MDKQTDLAALDDVGVHRVVNVAACVLHGVPLAAPYTGHAGHAPAEQMDWDEGALRAQDEWTSFM